MKIVLDAGHGGFDNGATYKGRKEKDDNLELTLAVGKRLEADGYDVIYTRTTDVYDSPFEKAQIANEQRGDWFLSIHRNDSIDDNEYNGIQTLIYQKGSEAEQLASKLNENLSGTGFYDIGIEERPGLVVLRRTKMPAVLLEAGFLNSDQDNEIFDQRFEQIADAIADAVREIVPVKEKGPDPKLDMQEGRYAVQTGLFCYGNNAKYQAQQLRADGYEPRIARKGRYYQVFVEGNSLERAQELERQLKEDHYDTLLVFQ